MTHKVNSGCGYSPTKSSHSLVAVAAATVVVVYYIMLTSIYVNESETERERACVYVCERCVSVFGPTKRTPFYTYSNLELFVIFPPQVNE